MASIPIMKATLALLALVILLPARTAEAALDLDLYARLLERHTRAVSDPAGTRVDYEALRSSSEWRSLVDGLATADPDALASREARLAFWINVYNLLAIDLVVQGRPETSIRDLGSLLRPVWKKRAGRVGGRDVTLKDVEHGILRPMGEPRIHVAIVCASTSCPSLRRDPFRAEALDRQLDEQAAEFLANRDKGLRIDRKEEDLRVSRIFDWFEDDFGGQEGVVAFVLRHAPAADRPWLHEHADEVDVVYFDYDWRLNALPR
jgi:hypothetical protein